MINKDDDNYKISEKYDLTGKMFGRLKVIEFSHSNGQRMWECECDCDDKTRLLVSTANLNRGNTKSCGCYQKDMASKTNKGRSIYDTPEKRNLKQRLRGMTRRCHDEDNKDYKNYGGRGIKVCDEWLDKENGFDNFYHWAMVNGYQKHLTIDRIDNDKDYSPDNCRWVSIIKQSNNKSTNVYIEIDGEVHTVAEWSKIKGIERKTLEWRVRKGWDKEDLFNPPRKCKGINY